ncbi:MAG: hypothetical protein REH83_04310 [Rickettsiella sp.]|nr:hypothetical protein [Rickettsiella sp.]
MIKIKYLSLAIGISFLATPFIANANSTSTDPLQYYRDEIKQAQNDATQKLLDKLRPYTKNSNSYPNEAPTPSATATPIPEQSNAEKAFSPPPRTTPKQAADATTPANNPWVKPNPWESQSKINPWANSPIPGPTPPPSPPSSNASLAPNNMPNIFAPPQSPTTSGNKLPNNTSY